MLHWTIMIPINMCPCVYKYSFTIRTIVQFCIMVGYMRTTFAVNNDLEDLLIERLAKKLFSTWERENVIPTSDRINHFRMVDDLKGLYSTLRQHPALMDRRLAVGGRFAPPPLPLSLGVDKRSAIGLAQPVCPFRAQWSRLLFAKDKNNTEVEVFQHPNRYQWFYTVTCDFVRLQEEDPHCPVCCRAINHRRYTSECVARQTYVMALVRPAFSNVEYDWDYIQVDTSCNCAVATRH